MRVAVGCPIRSRAWIFPQWEEHVRVAFDVAGLTPHWIFAIGVGPTGQDDGTQKMVTDLYRDEPGIWTEISEPDTSMTRVNWTKDRFNQMAHYRNRLLGMVRSYQPDYFLSLDSDILLHPSALVVLLETLTKTHNLQGVKTDYDAVAGKAFLSNGGNHLTTYGFLNPNGGISRQNATGVFPVQIIMALKLMKPSAYNVDYDYHPSGEDIGWSLACAAAGLKLGWDGRVISKHCMFPEMLHKVDHRVGW